MPIPSEILAADGPIARHVAGFAPRPQQQAMADAVASALEENGVLVAEAGTGTGKTFAYLVPALLSGKKVIISTGTKNLQDQLYHRDLPVVRKALGVPVASALLKGRANYLCRHRLELAEQRAAGSRQLQDALVRVRAWAGRTRSGDISGLSEVPEDAPVWPLATSTADNCLGQECPHWSDCFLVKARRNAQAADILVVNHHLLFADMALRDEGFGEVLPGAHALILDEAHQLPEVASNFFGLSLGSRQLLELANDTVTEQVREAGDMASLRDAADAVQTAARDLRLALGKKPRRGAWHQVAAEDGVKQAMERVECALAELEQALAPAAERGKGLDSCWRRTTAFAERLALLKEAASDSYVHWFETFATSFALHLTPMDISEPFRTRMDEYRAAWVFTSATLAVDDGFEHFTGRLGLAGADTARWDSPFDFARQALFYIPEQLPLPSDPGHTVAVVAAARPILEASQGRAFLLFTSHRALQQAAALLEDTLDYPLLVQGSMPRAELLERFRELGNAVLLGTGSFWEGVDVRGEALSCVIIDKLPFAAPDDPVLQARIQSLREQGGNPFMEYQLPNAVIALKQGVGRLIRDVNDRGVLALCDPRILTHSYGRVFRNSLPPMPLTRSLDDVRRFFSSASAAEARSDVRAN